MHLIAPCRNAPADGSDGLISGEQATVYGPNQGATVLITVSDQPLPFDHGMSNIAALDCCGQTLYSPVIAMLKLMHDLHRLWTAVKGKAVRNPSCAHFATF